MTRDSGLLFKGHPVYGMQLVAFLFTGVTIAFFHSLGMWPIDNELYNNKKGPYNTCKS